MKSPTRYLWIEWLTHALATRTVQFVLLPLLVLAWFAWSDPSQGAADTLLRVQLWAQAVLITGVAYLVSRGLSGRVRGEGLAEAAQRGSVASGVAFAGLCVLRGLVLLGLLLFFAGSIRAEGSPAPSTKADLPPAALRLLPTLRAQVVHSWPDMPAPAYLGALIEHESCITLTHPRCWSPASRLKTAREEGAGLGQLTRAWDRSGRLRFDALADTRRLDPRGLAELRWDTVYQRPDLQMRALVVSTRRTYGHLTPLVPAAAPRLAMTDAAYNGGLGGVLNERRACALRAGCHGSAALVGLNIVVGFEQVDRRGPVLLDITANQESPLGRIGDDSPYNLDLAYRSFWFGFGDGPREGGMYMGTAGEAAMTTTLARSLGTGDFTLELWIRPESGDPESDPDAVYLQLGANADGHDPDGRVTLARDGMSSPHRLSVNAQREGQSVTVFAPDDSTTLPEYEWTHVAVVNRAGTWSLFIGGHRTGTANPGPIDVRTDVFIGGNAFDTANFVGAFDDVRITAEARYDHDFNPLTVGRP